MPHPPKRGDRYRNPLLRKLVLLLSRFLLPTTESVPLHKYQGLKTAHYSIFLLFARIQLFFLRPDSSLPPAVLSMFEEQVDVYVKSLYPEVQRNDRYRLYAPGGEKWVTDGVQNR